MMKNKEFYQYQPPVAMFSMAEVDHTDRADFGIVNAIKEPFRRYGRKIAENIEGQLQQKTQAYAKASMSGNAAARQKAEQELRGVTMAHKWATSSPGKVGAIAAGVNLTGGAIGVAGLTAGYNTFTRRRRTKNGKVVVEQVRRGQ